MMIYKVVLTSKPVYKILKCESLIKGAFIAF